METAEYEYKHIHTHTHTHTHRERERDISTYSKMEVSQLRSAVF